jgi:hypothetical protein
VLCNGFIKTAWSKKGAIALAFLTLVLSACEQRRVVRPVQPEVVSEVEPIEPTGEATDTGAVTTTAPGAGTDTAARTPTPRQTPLTAPSPAAPEAAALPNANLLGENVTVSTKIQSVLAPNVFTVYDKESLRGQVVLVVSEQPAPPVGTNIELTGIVRNFVLADVNREYGLNISPDLVTNYINKPYVAAKAIEPVD